MKNRSIATCIILSIVTCGIYSLYWFYSLTNDSKELGQDDVTASGGMAIVLVIITCGIYAYYWAYKRGQNIDTAQDMRGLNKSNNGVLYLILCFFQLELVAYAILQSEINKLIDQKDNISL